MLEPNQKKYTKVTGKHLFTNIMSNLWKAVTYLIYKKQNNTHKNQSFKSVQLIRFSTLFQKAGCEM